MRRAASSIPSNIAESSGRVSNKEKQKFIEYAFCSLSETMCQLELSLDIGYITQEEFQEYVNNSDLVISHGASGSIMKALNAGKKVIAVTRLEKYGEHINDHQIQNNEAFSSNNYVLMASLELDDLDQCINKIKNNTDGTIPWENKDPLSIVKIIDKFIQENFDVEK